MAKNNAKRRFYLTLQFPKRNFCHLRYFVVASCGFVLKIESRPWQPLPTALQRIFVSPFRLNWSLSSSEIGDIRTLGGRSETEREKASESMATQKRLEGDGDRQSDDQTMSAILSCVLLFVYVWNLQSKCARTRYFDDDPIYN